MPALILRLEQLLLKHGVPQEVVDKIAVLEHKAGEIAIMVVLDGRDAAITFINAEFAKVKEIVSAAA
jgi:hypothetical protein